MKAGIPFALILGYERNANKGERDMGIEIIKTESEYDLYCHYRGQIQRQGCYIELDCANETLHASYNAEIGNAIPVSVYHGHDQRFGIDLLRGSTADALMEEILALAERVIAGYESIWNDYNNVATFTDDAQEAIEEIRQRCEREEGDIQVWEASEWLNGVTYYNDNSFEIEGVGTVTAKTTDEEISEMENKIDEMAAEDAVFLNGIDNFLKYLRSGCTVYYITDGNATEERDSWEAAVEVAENWYDYLSDEDSIDHEMTLTADYSDIDDDDVDALNAAIRAFEKQLAEDLGYEAFNGHGNYSVDAASKAGFNLSVSYG